MKKDFVVEIVNLFSVSGYRYLFIFFLFGIHLECPSKSYGKNCLQTCNEKCYTSRTCDRKTGACDGGCVEGWKPPLCDAGICNTVIIIMLLILSNYFWNKYLFVFKMKRIYNFQLCINFIVISLKIVFYINVCIYIYSVPAYLTCQKCLTVI